MLPLRCAVQNYEWGCLGLGSSVARLQQAATGAAIELTLPYAELWMGTHPSGPSQVCASGGQWELLQDWLTAHPAALGASGAYSAASALPYLLKVLSVGKALSVQAHPDRALAGRLHAARPDLYKDANHKPEMAIALTPFEAMCSFRAPADLAARLRGAPELRALAGEAPTEALLAAAEGGSPIQAPLKAWYAALMGAPPAAVAQHTQALAARLGPAAGGGSAAATVLGPSACGAYSLLCPDSLARRLLAQYPGDIGVFSPYLLNTLRLPPGAGLFLGSGEPHAYLAGDCVEVMACSDNVVRAGLTPKFKDVATLVDMLTYSASGSPAVTVGSQLPPPAAHTRLYDSPVPEFQVHATVFPEGQLAAQPPASSALPCAPCPSILIVTQGQGLAVVGAQQQALAAGQVWLLPAGVQLTLQQQGEGGLAVYRALARA